MIFAAIDIGSNAARLQVSRVTSYNNIDSFKRVEYIRFPLRLGLDVFKTGSISDSRRLTLKKLMRSFMILIDIFNVDDYMACATSAMREAQNGSDIVEEVYIETGIRIHIIDGNEEAIMINRSITSVIDDHNYLHIDVGGGSTELSLFKGQKKVISKSFPIGSIRKMNEDMTKEAWETMKNWIQEKRKDFKKIKAIGTGGNINKLSELADIGKNKEMTYNKLKSIRTKLSQMDESTMINHLMLNPDRADVIIPASDIYLNAMNWSGARRILVPRLGLKDGIISSLYLKNKSQLSLEFQKENI